MNARDFSKQRALIDRQYPTQRQRSKAMGGLIKRAGATMLILHGRHIGWRLRTGETVCIKERFTSELKAHQAIERITASVTDGHRVPTRFYACQRCSGWHITSQAPKYLQV